jgi:putative endonuclease
MEKKYYVYLVASLSGVLYTGVTNSVLRRAHEHKEKRTPGFSQKYNVDRLVYFEVFRDIRNAIRREKQIKSWRREKKVALIESTNPKWEDLVEKWFGKS